MENRETTTTPMNLQKLLTPASDSHEFICSKNKKMYASSYFYAPTHPTVEDQVELARRISNSLSDVKNMKSKGQSMYVNRKKRSVKWIHDGNGVEDEEEPPTPAHKDKIPLKCMMNPNGKVLDIHGIQALGEEVNISPVPSNPEKLFDIVRDLNNQRGRGAEIFAKRRKRSEKWVVDKETPQTPTTPATPRTPVYPKQEMNENANYSSNNGNKTFFNPFTMDLSLDGTNRPTTGRQQSRCYGNECPHSQYPQEVKKIYLREVAVGTDTDFSEDSCQVERSRRASFTNNYFQPSAYQQPYQTVPNHKNCNQSNYNRSTRSKPTKSISKPQNGIAVNNDNRNGKQQIKPRVIEANQKSVDESEYTPVPVRQLIQEFEKTCRPALQYKHISPKVIPIDNDIARFFETRNAPVKYEEEGEEDEEEDEEEEDNEYERVNPRNGNGYVSTDDTECTTDEDSSGSPLNSFSIIPPASRQTASSTMSTGERDFYAIFSEDFANRRRSSTSQELENLYRNNDDKYANSEQELPVQAKSLLLSMVASQEDILDTIKHLRSTPVLDNLLASSTPDCKFTDLYPKLTDAGKLYENETYKGPKIASINNLANYNTAPRGWDQSLTYYRPIKFEKPQEIVYSDF